MCPQHPESSQAMDRVVTAVAKLTGNIFLQDCSFQSIKFVGGLLNDVLMIFDMVAFPAIKIFFL